MGNSNRKQVASTDQVNLNHFRLLRVVGKGAFGKVRIVQRKDSGLTFALKYMRKDDVVRSESARNIIRERQMLERLNHPFLCNLRYSFQDFEYMYLVVDLMNGGDLRFHISRKTFTEEAVRFWVAELACAVEYVHKQGIVHRDIKPDNVLLDAEGHVHLADFNVASEFTPSKPLMSKPGTLAYLAPEVYKSRGYSSECDWWSLGALFYECIYNKRAFEANNHEALAKKIMKAQYSVPVTNPPVSMECMHAITSLLEKEVQKRIGASGFDTFCNEPFFRAIDFGMLERKELEPVFVPSTDKPNFDPIYELEELLLGDVPLEARTRHQKPRAELRANATDQQRRDEEIHRMIETLFEPFDYTTAAYDRYSDCMGKTDRAVGEQPDCATAADEPRVTIAADPLVTDRTESALPPLLLVHPALQNQAEALRNNLLGNGTVVESRDGPVSYSRPLRCSARSMSAGGTPVVLGETGSWSETATQIASPVNPGGILGFLKGGRRASKPRERGVLGKKRVGVV